MKVCFLDRSRLLPWSLLLASPMLSADLDPAGTLRVLPWPEGRPAAYSISFDDGYLDNFLLAAPLLESFGLRGTFYLNGGWMDEDWTLSWEEARQLVNRGHEIGNHSLTHLHLERLPLGRAGQSGTARHEVIESARRITDRVLRDSPQPALTFAFPFGDPLLPELSEAVITHHIAGRDASGHANKTSAIRWESLRAWAPRFPEPRTSKGDQQTLQTIKERIQQEVIETHSWGIILFHSVKADYAQISGSLDTSTLILREILTYLARKEASGELWIDTVLNLARYRREAEALRSEIVEQSESRLRLRLSDHLEDAVYNFPLTVEVSLPSEWSGSVWVSQGPSGQTKTIPISPDQVWLRISIDPTAGDLLLQWVASPTR